MPLSTFTSLDILYLVLSASIIILVVFIAVLLINITLVLRDFRKVSKTAGNITEKVHEMILTPVSYITKISESLTPYIEEYIKKQMAKKSKK